MLRRLQFVLLALLLICLTGCAQLLLNILAHWNTDAPSEDPLARHRNVEMRLESVNATDRFHRWEP